MSYYQLWQYEKYGNVLPAAEHFIEKESEQQQSIFETDKIENHEVYDIAESGK